MAQSSEETLVSVLSSLKDEGFTLDFNLTQDCLECDDIRLHPQDFEIVRTIRLEGESDPDDNLIVYAIESRQGQKGTLLTPYGVYADESRSADLVAKLSVTRE
ncbi:hypothetical protein [Siphonobacter aquaeclarae]|jgi:hypothetical protein|uniref:Phosphoribosylpyrophosphate synthetase n=1 Tax=Siphonobacter aquaeclarae TaxID=563176 RepID=A0A1G9R5P4_9BACT|nr:hypothetical protein [Siphonobacter aquaeclarae]MBO9640161.1 phosphoribosylpyrophosphate synthetase [Siphonobacter aquaeclarae]SDM18430.1 hypothetical protein SAMN04488090_2747 [Siphonobacter aquaeclarae]